LGSNPIFFVKMIVQTKTIVFETFGPTLKINNLPIKWCGERDFGTNLPVNY